MSTVVADPRELDIVATEDSGRGYLRFLDHVVVDAQPKKLMFARIAEVWQWERAERIARAIEHLSGYCDDYTGPQWFWNGYHKGSDKTHETARQLCWLLGWSRRKLNIVICAGKEDQAALITKAMRGIIADNPWVGARVRVTELTARGESGSELSVLSMNAYGAHGAFPDYIVAEEITHWQHDEGQSFWESFVLGSINKRPHCVLNVTTNAGTKQSWQWHERNRAAQSRYWSFYEAPFGPPLPRWMDQEKIADASQGMLPGERDRLYKNRWVDPGEEYGYLTHDDCMLCRDLSLEERHVGSPLVDYYAVVDYGGVSDRCALSVLHAESTGSSAIVDRLDCWQGTHDDRIAIDYDAYRPCERSVEGWLKTVLKNFRIVGLILDPHQLEGLAIKYERRGVRVHRIEYRGGKTNYRLAQILKTSIQNRKVSWSPKAGLLPASYVENGRTRRIDDVTLEQELSSLVVRTMSYGYRFDHESGSHDDRSFVVAAGLLHVLPTALPEGGVGPTVVVKDRRDEYRPPGRGRDSEDVWNERKDVPNGFDASVGRWGLFGVRE